METGIQQSRVNDNKEISASSIGGKEKRKETDVNIMGGTRASRTSHELPSASGTDLILAQISRVLVRKQMDQPFASPYMDRYCTIQRAPKIVKQ